MNYLNRIAQIENRASKEFHNFSGGLESYGYANEAEMQPSYEELDSQDRTLTFKISNSDPLLVKTARIFGSTKDLQDLLVDPAITITVDESSHLQVKTEILQNPIRIGGLKYVVSDVAQFSNNFILKEATSTGAENNKRWQPLGHRSSMNQIATQIDAPAFDLLVSANTFIEIPINPATSVTLTLTLSQRVSMRNALQNRPISTTSLVAAPTGTFDTPAIANLKKRMM